MNVNYILIFSGTGNLVYKSIVIIRKLQVLSSLIGIIPQKGEGQTLFRFGTLSHIKAKDIVSLLHDIIRQKGKGHNLLAARYYSTPKGESPGFRKKSDTSTQLFLRMLHKRVHRA